MAQRCLYRRPIPGSDLGAQVTYYVEPGIAPTARVFQPNSAEHTSLIIDIVGHLVPVQ